jgi:hypothetical protein
MGRAFGGLSVLLCLSPLMFGQGRDRVEVFGGYSLVTGDFTGTYADGNSHRLNGWNVSATYKANHWFGIVADFSGFYPSYTFPGIQPLTVSAHSLSYLFGPQISLPVRRLTPFAHFLMGATHINYPVPSGCGSFCVATTANSFTIAPGGGVDVTIAKHFAIRGQVDLLHSGFSNPDNQLAYKYHESNARVSAGLVLRF